MYKIYIIYKYIQNIQSKVCVKIFSDWNKGASSSYLGIITHTALI